MLYFLLPQPALFQQSAFRRALIKNANKVRFSSYAEAWEPEGAGDGGGGREVFLCIQNKIYCMRQRQAKKGGGRASSWPLEVFMSRVWLRRYGHTSLKRSRYFPFRCPVYSCASPSCHLCDSSLSELCAAALWPLLYRDTCTPTLFRDDYYRTYEWCSKWWINLFYISSPTEALDDASGQFHTVLWLPLHNSTSASKLLLLLQVSSSKCFHTGADRGQRHFRCWVSISNE